MARRGAVGVLAAAIVLAAAAGEAGTAGSVHVGPGNAIVVPPRIDPARLRVPGKAGLVLGRRLEAAAMRLDRPACQGVLADFPDVPSFRPGARLSALGLTPAQYLAVLVFVDGQGLPLCRSGHVAAATTPHGRVVFICPARFAEVALQDPERAEALLIHESLHSLGLTEDPPGSDEITRRVRNRCEEDFSR